MARREERRRGERKEWEKGDERGVEEGEEQCLWMHTLISTKKTFQINPGSQKDFHLHRTSSLIPRP